MAEVTKEEVQRRRDAFECQDYVPIRDHYRCKQYVDGGSCTRDDYFMCVEWMNRNPHHRIEPAVVAALPAGVEESSGRPPRGTGRSTKGTHGEHATLPMADGEPTRRRALAGERSGVVYDLSSLGKKVEGDERIMLERPELLTEHAIEQLSNQGYEVTVATRSGTEVTLVPSYTQADRAELSYCDARTLVMVLQVFPDATIDSLRKPDEDREAS